MQRKKFKKVNTMTAWLMFVVSAVVYGVTVEPTASLWDCPEFIACGYKLEIGHPPGAPVFMLAANLFSQFASNPSQVAYMVNMLSALLSAGCIFFLHLTITHLAQRLVLSDGETLTHTQAATILICGITGSLAYTFSDTFWYSAVEGEVYAFSSFLTALMFWLILKWEEEADSRYGARWIVLIAYITGLSIGVHLLCLLCLPAMALVVYHRKTAKTTFLGNVKAIALGGLLVGVILFGIIPGITKLGGWAELLFTNVLDCPYNTGLIVYIVLMFGAIIAVICRTKRKMVWLGAMSLLMLLIGYSSYAVIFIRANANTPMNENAPSNIFALGSYLSREQYGDTPLIYGHAYTSEVDYEHRGNYMVPKKEIGRAIYRPDSDSSRTAYDIIRHDIKYVYKENMWFPRMHSQRHAQAYEDWLGGVEKKGNLPTAAENLHFFVSYQLNFMYWRYFLWNFVGRQNNIQGHGEVEHGNWITGISWIDDWLLGCDTSKMPTELKDNPGRNVFYGLPLLLGLLGICFQWRRGAKGHQQLLVVSMLFVMTGIAIVFYLNQTPMQPRERDYAYAGSFYAFAIWIGLGVAALPRWARLLCLLIPLQMATQTWDDHDRSGRYTCRDFGANYLESMQREGNPIILTSGDNDTFPLWYNHDVEGKRTDTRCCNLEYLQTDWYIDQMKRPVYDSPALPISWQHYDYQDGRREAIPIMPELKTQVEQYMAQHPDEARKAFGEQPFELKNILQRWVLNNDPEMQCIPTDTVTITSPEGTMNISLKGKQALYKNDLMVLEMLSHGDWRRPIYASISLGPDNLWYLQDHYVLEGLAYRISPKAQEQQVDVKRLYDNVMNHFRYGGMNTKGIYLDQDVLHMAKTHQHVMAILIDSLVRMGDINRALKVCRKWQQEMPQENVPYTDAALVMAQCYYLAGRTTEGDAIVNDLLHRADEWLSWIDTIIAQRRGGSSFSARLWMKTMQKALAVAYSNDRKEIIKRYAKVYEKYYQ